MDASDVDIPEVLDWGGLSQQSDPEKIKRTVKLMQHIGETCNKLIK